MTLSALPNFVGSTVSLSDAQPPTVTKADYEALTYSELGLAVSVGDLGNKSEGISQKLLSGAVIHSNGAIDLGEVPFTVVYSDNDAGLAIVAANSNTNNMVTIKVVDPDEEHHYFQGVLANYTLASHTATTEKGVSFVVRGDARSLLLHQAAPT